MSLLPIYFLFCLFSFLFVPSPPPRIFFQAIDRANQADTVTGTRHSNIMDNCYPVSDSIGSLYQVSLHTVPFVCCYLKRESLCICVDTLSLCACWVIEVEHVYYHAILTPSRTCLISPLYAIEDQLIILIFTSQYTLQSPKTSS